MYRVHLRISTEVKTVLPSILMPGGTKGTEPGARMMFWAVTISSVPAFLILLGPAYTPSAWICVRPSVRLQIDRYREVYGYVYAGLRYVLGCACMEIYIRVCMCRFVNTQTHVRLHIRIQRERQEYTAIIFKVPSDTH
jgi:hypothetical protein